jgi:hypothetical protein
MARWPTPRHLEGKLATRRERAHWTRVQLTLRTCGICRGVFRDPSDANCCTDWHRQVWTRMRADLNAAIDRLSRRIQRGDGDRRGQIQQRDRLFGQLRKLP